MAKSEETSIYQDLASQSSEPSCSVEKVGFKDGILAHYDFRKQTPAQIEIASNNLIDHMTRVYKTVARKKTSFENTVQPMVIMEQEAFSWILAIQMAGMVATDPDLRAATTQAMQNINNTIVDLDMNEKVFNKFSNIWKNREKASSCIKGCDKELLRFVEKFVTGGERSGLTLLKHKRDELKHLKKQMGDLCLQFTDNLNSDTTHVYLSEGQLDGLPGDFIESLERNSEGNLKVTMKYPHYLPIMKNCRNPETRALLEKTYMMRQQENVGIIEKLINLRHEHANLLGFSNHASFVQSELMARNPARVADFLGEVEDRCRGLWEKERKLLLQLKEEESRELGLDYCPKLFTYDLRYYATMVERRMYAVDHNKLREYFPIERVTAGLMRIYETLLGLKFRKVAGDVWEDTVEMWEVKDQETEDILGYFYLDMFPRDGKYGHACMEQLQPGCVDGAGKRLKSVVALICNFTRPTKSEPSLLDHSEVVVFFHEFGHVMHGICSRTNTARFFGGTLERDFVEAPSQMLEHWAWEEQSLRQISGHYKDNSPIPQEMMDKLIASRNANIGMMTLRQVVLAKYDQYLHTHGTVDTEKAIGAIYLDTLGIEVTPGTNLANTFGHLVGYDGQYYGYLWSNVFSEDMFYARFAEEGIDNPSTGKQYREAILEPGSTRDAIESLRCFLGREPSSENFFSKKGFK